VEVDGASPVKWARLAITADNSFECRLNGKAVGSGTDFTRAYVFDVTRLLRPGPNVLAVVAENGASAPNPAGLAARLEVRHGDGRTAEVVTDRSWSTASSARGDWMSSGASADGWEPAMELGRIGMAPWGDIGESIPIQDVFTDIEALSRLAAELGTPPDFAAATRPGEMGLRAIHRAIGGTDAWFVASGASEARTVLCSFRAAGRRPELWHPDTGRSERPAVWDAAGGITRIPIRFDPLGSVFVVFPAGAPAGDDRIVSVERDGATVASAEPPAAGEAGAGDPLAIAGTFTIAVWARPGDDTELPREAVEGLVGMTDRRNDVLYPPPGHEVVDEPGHLCCGIAAGRNGVCVFEHGADHFAPPLVHPARLEGWTHIAVVYEDGRPTLWLDGKEARKGLRSGLVVHPGVGVRHGRAAAPFRGDRGEPRLFSKALGAGEIAGLVRTGPPRAVPAGYPAIDLAIGAGGAIEASAREPGKYVLRSAGGAVRTIEVGPVPAPVEVAGPWDLRFPAGGGALERIVLDRLASWSGSAEAGVRFFSGTATYRKTVAVPAEMAAPGRRLFLDLGAVEVMASVRLNGRDLGILWKRPYRVEVTGAARAGDNVLEVEVTNLPINRQIGDEELPDDSDRHANGTLKAWPGWLAGDGPSPTGRRTFTSWRLWRKGEKPVPSGLIGPVRLEAAVVPRG